MTPRWGTALRGSLVLSLPVADAARFAGPDLNSGIEGLGVDGIAKLTGELRTRQLALRHGALVDDTGVANHDLGLDRGFASRLDAVASAIDGHIKRARREAGGRTQRLGRKHRPGKVQAKEFVRTVFVRRRQTAPRHYNHANSNNEHIPQGHRGLLKYAKSSNLQTYLGGVQANSSGFHRQGYRGGATPLRRRPVFTNRRSRPTRHALQ